MKKIVPTLILTSLLVSLSVMNVYGQKTTPAILWTEEEAKLDPIEVLKAIVNWAFYILLIVATLFFIIAAFYFITARGETEQVNKAKQMLLYGIIGLVVAILAKGVVGWILGTIIG